MISKTGKFRACRGNHPAALIIQTVLRLRKSWLLNFYSQIIEWAFMNSLCSVGSFCFKTKEQEKKKLKKTIHLPKTT